MPSLRERQQDIQTIANQILVCLCNDMQFPSVPKINFDAMNVLCSYSWPGNVRELRNVLERALIISRGNTIRIGHLGITDTTLPTARERPGVLSGRSLYDVIGDTERFLIEDALVRANGKKHEAARLLGISRFALVRHMIKLGLIER